MRKKDAANAAHMMVLAELAGELKQRLDQASHAATELERLRSAYAEVASRPIRFSEITDCAAQTTICLAAAWSLLPDQFTTSPVRQWLVAQAHPLWRPFLLAATAERAAGQVLWRDVSIGDLLERVRYSSQSQEIPATDEGDPLAHFFEKFLAAYCASERRRWGVFFTPRPIARSMLRRIDQLLRDDFQWAHGLAALATGDPINSAQMLDPAAGSGAFLIEAIELIKESLRTEHQREQAGGWQNTWCAAVSRFMPRLIGYELLLPACAMAQLRIAEQLWKTGFRFDVLLPLNVLPHNPLAGPHLPETASPPATENKCECLIVVGNPPFAGISRNDDRWSADLLRGVAAEDASASSYFHVQGQPLGERKVWLNDDYVKFFRYAQWRVCGAGAGILAFVSNHAYLDNATFRGMRASLMNSFPQIDIVDLHGNAKRRERDRLGNVDENVFGIEQGVAIGYFAKRSGGFSVHVRRADVWGSTAAKLQCLSADGAGLQWHTIHPAAPHYLFTRRAAGTSILPKGIALNEVFSAYCTAPITARDHFVVSITREELLERLETFRDLSIPDDVIRERYFRRTRSALYAAGDTRGWKLAEARRRMAECDDFESYIQRCAYRPLDERYVFWTDWMIDWPRPQLTRQAAIEGNWFLITRRQMLPNSPANFFWITDQLALDGIIRSDNRGSEALFPLYDEVDGKCRSNFDRRFVETIAARTGQNNRPDELADYIYGLFWSTSYREAFADQFCSGYPCVLLPRDRSAFVRLRMLGGKLRHCHLLRTLNTGERANAWIAAVAGARIERGYPRFRDETVWINADAGFARIARYVWNSTIGAHQVCRKWLTARRGRMLAASDVEHFERLVMALEQTHELVAELDTAIAESGGLRRTFGEK